MTLYRSLRYDQDEDFSILEEDNSQIYAHLDNVLVHMIDKQQTAIFKSNQDFNIYLYYRIYKNLGQLHVKAFPEFLKLNILLIVYSIDWNYVNAH